MIKQWSIVLSLIWSMWTSDTWLANFQGCEGIKSINLLMLRKWITIKLTQNYSILYHRVWSPHFLGFTLLSVLTRVPTVGVVNVKLERLIQLGSCLCLQTAACVALRCFYRTPLVVTWWISKSVVTVHMIPAILERMLYKLKAAFSHIWSWFRWY